LVWLSEERFVPGSLAQLLFEERARPFEAPFVPRASRANMPCPCGGSGEGGEKSRFIAQKARDGAEILATLGTTRKGSMRKAKGVTRRRLGGESIGCL